MNRFKFLVVVLIIIFNQQSSGCNKFIIHPPENDSVKPVEKVYLHIDRDTYYPGDDIWFKAYLIDALDHTLSNYSHNLHVELISPSLKIISGRIIRLEKGLGNGDFKLPHDVSSGRYKIRAYTNYMRNFSDQLFFTKDITIVSGNDRKDKLTEKVKYVEKRISLNFFPEGGSMVNNVSSLVAFKAVDYLGRGCNVTGKIYSSDGTLITTFKSTHLGMGSFFLKPFPGLKYYSIARGADSIDFRNELPVSFPTGVVLNASRNQDNELLITTKTNSETLAHISDENLVLSLSIRKEVINKISVRIKSLITSFVVPTEYLPDGILMLTLSTSENLPLSERLVFKEKEAPVKINIETDKNLYKTREPVSIKLSFSGDSTIEREGNISLSVVDENFTNTESKFQRTISSWFLLESDIRGNIEEPSYYFDPSNPERLKNMDLLLLTQGWRDFTWKYDTIYFPPEDGFTISGKFRKNNKNKPVENPRVSIGIFGSRSTLLKSVPVDSVGKFNLSGIDLTGEATLIATGIGKKDRPEGLLTLDSITYNPAKLTDILILVSVIPQIDTGKLKSYYEINEAIRKKYRLSDTIKVGEVNIISERHKDPQIVKVEKSRLKYEKPDAEFIVTESMDGYPNVPELIRGKIPGVEVIGPKNGDEYAISIRGGQLSVRGTGKDSTYGGALPPLVLIDGNPATFEDLLIMPTAIIDRIDVLKLVSSTVIFGFQGYNGVINMITKAGGAQQAYKPVDYSARLKFSGYNAPRIFYSPQHLTDSNSDPKPDLRNTLLWNPNINLDSSKGTVLNFYNGDNSSLIRIIAEGITTNGIPVTGNAEYEVR
jgi:hypothetical protein